MEGFLCTTSMTCRLWNACSSTLMSEIGMLCRNDCPATLPWRRLPLARNPLPRLEQGPWWRLSDNFACQERPRVPNERIRSLHVTAPNKLNGRVRLHFHKCQRGLCWWGPQGSSFMFVILWLPYLCIRQLGPSNYSRRNR